MIKAKLYKNLETGDTNYVKVDFGDGTEWRAHGDFNRIDKFLKIANGVKAAPDKVLQKILDKKGITKIRLF